MIVVDASAVVLLVADAGSTGEAVHERVLGERLAAPHLLDVEVAHALLGRHRGEKLSDRQLDAAYVTLAEGLQVPLVTCDARIARSGSARCKIEVLGSA
ncbi:type II toxin-antitoxin system VapC family toxin [Streptomyces sp. NPDC051578]|uniref:type II toxin-antitoxin system VapC family toxin n=1 Tax=Streptomyces sp. NPDC051578 TaxID=3365662 RepID=UPI0037A9D6DF